MEYTKLGTTDIEVSRLCVGCMSFGDPASKMHAWTLNPQESEAIIKHALDLGINFFDTANCYSAGTSEEYLGKAIKNNIAREKVILATKVYFNEGKLSKEAIPREVEGSLKRLGTDYIDLLIIHRFDYDTPIEETMEALHQMVQSGKVRAIGASAMYGYQFMKMQYVAERSGWTKFVSMQNHYNLLYREDERELIPICNEQKVSRTPYSPLAAGRLSRPTWSADTLRSKTDVTAEGKYDATRASDMMIVQRVSELAEKKNATMTQIALAWQLAKGVASPIIGATKAKYLEDAVGSFNITLSQEEVAFLEAPYVPHKIVGAL
nr:aldo/keto reductase [uncultured Cellulosilyticum sp.]